MNLLRIGDFNWETKAIVYDDSMFYKQNEFPPNYSCEKSPPMKFTRNYYYFFLQRSAKRTNPIRSYKLCILAIILARTLCMRKDYALMCIVFFLLFTCVDIILLPLRASSMVDSNPNLNPNLRAIYKFEIEFDS